jgi:acetyl esterase/lipase
LLLFYGGYDMDTILHTGFASIEFMCRGFLGVDGHAYRERAQIASPIRHIDPGYPPSFIFSGERDKLHPQSVDFERALTAAGVEHRTLFFDGKRDPEAFHGFISAYFLRPARIAMKAALEFLDGLK